MYHMWPADHIRHDFMTQLYNIWWKSVTSCKITHDGRQTRYHSLKTKCWRKYLYQWMMA